MSRAAFAGSASPRSSRLRPPCAIPRCADASTTLINPDRASFTARRLAIAALAVPGASETKTNSLSNCSPSPDRVLLTSSVSPEAPSIGVSRFHCASGDSLDQRDILAVYGRCIASGVDSTLTAAGDNVRLARNPPTPDSRREIRSSAAMCTAVQAVDVVNASSNCRRCSALDVQIRAGHTDSDLTHERPFPLHRARRDRSPREQFHIDRCARGPGLGTMQKLQCCCTRADRKKGRGLRSLFCAKVSADRSLRPIANRKTGVVHPRARFLDHLLNVIRHPMKFLVRPRDPKRNAAKRALPRAGPCTPKNQDTSAAVWRSVQHAHFPPAFFATPCRARAGIHMTRPRPFAPPS